jgi:uncharacterized protein (DUF736 family)
MSDQYPKSDGALWPNDKKTAEKHPDWRGRITITGAQIKKLIEMGKGGQEPTIQVGAWKRRSKAGQNYIYLSAEVYVREENQSSAGWDDDAQGQNDAWGQPSSPAPQQQADDPFADDDIPF